MITVINFSHPLTPGAETEIKNRYGAGEANIRTIPVQVDTTQAIMPQVERIYQAALRAVGEVYGHPAAGTAANVDCIILPGLSVVAVPLANKFKTANIIILASSPGVTPPKFMPVELIRSGEWHV